jgi:hypothetical protein
MLVGNLLKQLGYQQITITYADDKPPSILQWDDWIVRV